MYIQEIPNQAEVRHINDEERARTTVDLKHSNKRSYEQNIIKKIEWINYCWELQPLVTLADDTTLFFDEFAWFAHFWRIGEHLEIYKEGGFYYARTCSACKSCRISG